jgi:hypothetical protein
MRLFQANYGDNKRMPVAPFEPTEVKIVERQDDAVVVMFQSAEGGEFPMKFQRPQLAGLVSQFEKKSATARPSRRKSTRY